MKDPTVITTTWTSPVFGAKEQIVLLDITELVNSLECQEENSMKQQIITLIEDMYYTPWCNHSHDCCGCWHSEVKMIQVNLTYMRAMAYIYHTQNV